MVLRGYSRTVRAISVTEPATIAAAKSSELGIFFITLVFGRNHVGTQAGTSYFSTLLKVFRSIVTHPTFSDGVVGLHIRVTLTVFSAATFVRFKGASFVVAFTVITVKFEA